MTKCFNAVSNRDAYEMAKYTYKTEPEGRLKYLEDIDFKTDFDLIVNGVEIVYDYPVNHRADFDNKEMDEKYKPEKSAIVKVDLTIKSEKGNGILGLGVGNHELFLYVIKTKEKDYWQWAETSLINPFLKNNN